MTLDLLERKYDIDLLWIKKRESSFLIQLDNRLNACVRDGNRIDLSMVYNSILFGQHVESGK